MDPWIWFLGGPSLLVLLYFARVQRAKRSEKRGLADQDSRDEGRYQRALADAKVEKYWNMVSRNYASGIHALVALGLHDLDSDQDIRGAIESMRLRTGKDPLSLQLRKTLEGVDLREFFRCAAEKEADLLKNRDDGISAVLASMKDSDG